MAEQVVRDICSICLCDYNQPKILHCQHSFCQICLEDYVHQTSTDCHFLCPACRSDVTLPEGGVNNLPSKPTNGVPRCGFADGCENVSSFRCRDCDQYLCRSCRRNHDSLKVFKGHVIVSWYEPESKGDKPETKPVHDERDLCPCGRGNMVEYLCEDCCKCVCYKCFIKHHNGHKMKDLQDEDVKQQIRDEIISLNDKLKHQMNRLGEFYETLKTKKTEVKTTIKETCDKIDIQVQKVCDEVKRIGENMKEEVKKTHLQDEENASSGISVVDDLNKLLEDTNCALEDIKAGMKTSSIVLEERSIVQKVERLDQLRHEVKDYGCRKMVIPDLRVMEFVAGEIDRDNLSGQVGNVVQIEGMFEVLLSIDDISEMKEYYSREIECGGLKWSVSLLRWWDDILEIGLNLINTSETRYRSGQVDYNIKLVNINNDHQSVMRHDVETFTPDSFFLGWLKLIYWSNLSDREAGFIDENNQFKIQVRLNKILELS